MKKLDTYESNLMSTLMVENLVAYFEGKKREK